MGLFGFGNKKKLQNLERENQMLKKRVAQLVDLCNEKDQFFVGSISDGLRHGSSAAGRHMADRKKYLRGKK